MYKILKKDGNAKRAEFETVHGKIQTPVFMNVATVAAIKGGVSTEDLEGIDTQVVLSNTYHLHPKVCKKMSPDIAKISLKNRIALGLEPLQINKTSINISNIPLSLGRNG